MPVPALLANLLPSLVSAGSSLIGNIFNTHSQSDTNKINQEEAQKNRDFQAQMQSDQNAFNLQMWEKNNAYNDPAAQIERLVKAGINPALALGGNLQNVATAASAGSAPSGSAASLTAPQLDLSSINGIVSQYNEMLKTRSELKVNEASAENIAADTQKKEAETENLGVTADVGRQNIEESKSRQALNEANVVKLHNETMTREQFDRQLDDQHKQIDKDIEYKSGLIGFVSEQTQGQMNLNKSFWKRFNAELAKTWSEVGLNNAMTETQKKEAEQLSRYIANYLSKGDGTEEGKTMFDILYDMQQNQSDLLNKSLESFGKEQLFRLIESASRSWNNVLSPVTDILSNLTPLGRIGKVSRSGPASTTRSHKNYYGD